MAQRQNTPQSDESLLGALAAVIDTPVRGEPDDQLALIQLLDRLSAACDATKARVSVQFAKDRIDDALADVATVADADASTSATRDSGAVIASARRSLTGELALAHRISPAAMAKRLGQYRTVVRGLPRVADAWSRGTVSSPVAMAVAREAHHLNDLQLADLDLQIAPALPGLTPKRAAGIAQRYCTNVDKETAIRRITANERDARVTCRPVADGLACVSIYAPTAKAVGMYAALRKTGQASQGSVVEGESLGMAMSREAFTLITGLQRAEDLGIEIQLVMSDTTLVTASGEPARLDAASTDGECWLPAEIAAHLAKTHTGDGPLAPRWLRRLYTDPITGTLNNCDPKRRSFTSKQRRFITLRDRHCTTPYCDAPIRDIDHAVPYSAGGATDTVNGNGKCQRCNLTKTHPGWTVTSSEAEFGKPHEVRTTTPSGRTFRSHPPPVLGAPAPPRRLAPDETPRPDIIRPASPLELRFSLALE